MMDAADGAPRVVVALVKDLFFSVKLGKELRAHGYQPRFAKAPAEFAALIVEADPVLGVIDLDAVSDWGFVRTLPEISDGGAMPLLVFGPHKDIEGRRAAKAAGVTRIVSTSQFHAEAPLLVARYARTPAGR